MREVLPEIERWRRRGKRVALATVVGVKGSAPRRPGARMAVSSDGEITGSVSGGCVEAAVAEEARKVLRTGRPRVLEFGYSAEEAWAVGLTCGGTIRVFLDRLGECPAGEEVYRELRRLLLEERPAVLATMLEGPAPGAQLLVPGEGDDLGTLGAPELDRTAREAARRLLGDVRVGGERSAAEAFELIAAPRVAEGTVLFVERFDPRPRLVVVGAGHVAAHLVPMARRAGFRTIVVDPRTALASPERFPRADRILARWPDEALVEIGLDGNTFLAVLSHDDKLDLPALRSALRSSARYVGALGSRRTQRRRRERLMEEGLTEQEIGRIHGPIGLDLGAATPAEIAVAILAEMVAVLNGRKMESRRPAPPGPSSEEHPG